MNRLKSSFGKVPSIGFLVIIGIILSLALANPAMAAAKKSRFVMAIGAEYESVDPHVKYDVPGYLPFLNMYDNLLRYQGNPPKIVPWLAEKHGVSADGMTWTFYLRKGAKFHDGTELKADAVRYSVERLLSMGKGPASAFLPIISKEDVTAKDDYTVVFKLKKPFSPFLAIIPMLAIVNPRIVKAHEKDGDWGAQWLSTNEAGSGAFVMKEWKGAAVGFLLEPFKDYWQPWPQKRLDEVEVRIIREISSVVMALKKGEVHGGQTYIPADVVEQLQKDPNVRVEPHESMRVMVLRMNNARLPLNDKNIRKALSHAFNYDAFIKDILKGMATRNCGPNPRNLWGYPKDAFCYDYNLEKAKEYLAKAKTKVTKPIVISYQMELIQTKIAAELFQSELMKIGVPAEARADTWPKLVASTKTPETTPDMWIHWVSTYYVDPDNWIGQMYDMANHGAWKASSWYKNEEVSGLLQKAREVLNQAERQKLYEKASQIVVDDAVDLWVYNTTEYQPLHKSVRNFQFCPAGSGQEYRTLYMEE